MYFNPRTPYGMRQKQVLLILRQSKFQSTHPLRDATFTYHIGNSCKFYFNPRTPYGMRHADHIVGLADDFISIHAPLTGCDYRSLVAMHISSNFNPRTPYGMRPSTQSTQHLKMAFQSTHPLRDATQKAVAVWTPKMISIHAPLTGCDNNRILY